MENFKEEIQALLITIEEQLDELIAKSYDTVLYDLQDINPNFYAEDYEDYD